MRAPLFRRIVTGLLRAVVVLALLLPGVTMARTDAPIAPHSPQVDPIISLGQAANYAILGYNINLHNTDVWDGPVGVGYLDPSGPGIINVEAPGFVHDAPVYLDPSATATGSTGPANIPFGFVTQEMSPVFADAMQAYNDALTLTVDQTISGNINSATTINATHGGQYVIHITGDIKTQLTLNPFPGQTTKFIVLVDGTVTLGGSDTIGASSAAGASDVLFVMVGTGTTLTSHVGNRVYGTMLAPYRGASFHGFDGSFIGGTLEAKFMSDCQIHYVSYVPLETGTPTPTATGPAPLTSTPTATPPNGVCVATTSITSNFNGTDIPEPRYIWFNSHLTSVSGLGNTLTMLSFKNQVISFAAQPVGGGATTNYNLTVPDATVVLNDSSVTTPTTTFDTGTNTWITQLPVGWAASGTPFLAGLAFPVPVGGINGGVNPVVWSGNMSSSNSSITGVNWQWAAAAYTSFTTSYNALAVKPVDNNLGVAPFNNSDQSGTPENYKSFVVGGARGGGGSNYTGSNSATGSITPCLEVSTPTPTFTPTVTATATSTPTATPTNTALPTPTRTVTPTNTPDNTEPGGGESLSGVRGVVFNDLNSNGSQEPGEPGMNGVLVQLFGPGPDGLLNTPDDVLVAQMTTITSAGVPGSYSFLGVNPGLYRVRETTPAGYTNTTPTNVAVLLVANVTSVVDFGNVIPSATVTATPTSTATATATSAATPTVTPTSASNTGVVTALVYRDLNNNGVQDVGEPGVGGVTVRLYAPGPDGILGTPDDVLLATQTTDGSGNTTFYNLTPGIYRVSETVPAGYTNTTPTSVGVSVSAGGTVAVKFGINLAPPTITTTPTPTATSTPALSTVAGTVFNDVNGNGVQDMGEPGLSGVTVQLVNPSTNTVVATTTTSPSGVYLFQNVTAGPYIVRETTPAGFTPTTPTNVPVFAPSGGVAIADFGNQQTGRVAGTVFNDVNGDGVQNVIEVGVSGVTVQLVNPTTNTVVATTTTGATGDYAFTGVAAGPYIVRETTPAGFTPTTPTNLAVSVPAGGSANADFGVQQTGRINGVVYYDHNMNGVQDGPESGLGGVVVSLYAPGPDNVLGSADDVLLATTTTVAGGGYSFSPVSPGSYLVRQTVPLGYVPTTPVNVPVVVPAGGAGQANFGDVQTGLVNGTVFYDWNGSTVQDPGEAGVSGVTVRLYSPGPDGFLGTVDDVLVATTTTASNGTYSFTAVTSGSYLVRELTPAGFTTTTPSAKPVVVPPNGVGVADFGLLQVGALSGVVFNDLNGNGVQEPSEPGIGGVTVDLLNPNTLAVIGTTTTAGDGRYGFSGLTPGSYLVRETDPAGFSSTTPNQVAAFVPANGAATVDFGDRAIGTISGVSFYDWNANGVQDPGEMGIGGVTIQLVDPSTSTILATTTTAVADGSYIFTNLAAGAYQVRETDPLGFTSTTPNQVNVTLPVGGSASADFGNRATSSVAGVVFNDVDGSGLQEFTEVGLSGVTVTLVSPGPDNLFGTGDDVTVATATTLPDGRYQFLGITPGTYQVRETDPAGFVSTTPNTVTVTAPLGGIGTANFGDQLRLQPTAVQVTAFTATATGSDVTVRWTTGNEVGLLGFQVWRSGQRDGDYRQVAPAWLPAQAASGGADYKVVERGLSAGVWYYRVMLVRLDGQPMGSVGPLRVKVAETPADRPFLP